MGLASGQRLIRVMPNERTAVLAAYLQQARPDLVVTSLLTRSLCHPECQRRTRSLPWVEHCAFAAAIQSLKLRRAARC